VYATLVDWIRKYDIGDVASIAGVIISVVGFVATLIGVYRSKRAAVQAAEAAKAVQESLAKFDTLVDFSAAITTLEEVKRMHRQGGSWSLLPDRYAFIRKMFVQLRNSTVPMTDAQKSTIQNALVNLIDIERQVEKALPDSTKLRAFKFNAVISDDIDALVAVLTQLKLQGEGDSK
jgi:hypothetical protein